MFEQAKATGGHKTIAIPSANALVYVVPPGRVFNGNVIAQAASTAAMIISGGSTLSMSPGANSNLNIPLALNSGDTVTFSSPGASLIGVESWA